MFVFFMVKKKNSPLETQQFYTSSQIIPTWDGPHWKNYWFNWLGLFFSNFEMYINPKRSGLVHRAPVSQYQCHPGGIFAAAAATAAILTVDVHRWQHYGHFGSTSFVVAGGRKEEMVLRTSRGRRSLRVKAQLNDEAKKVTGCSGLIMENWRWGSDFGGT